MHARHFLVGGLVVLGLAGCGRSGPPMHSEGYYLQHPKATAKVVSYCTKHAKALRDHPHEYAHTVTNCDNAGNADLQLQFNKEFWGNGKPPKVTRGGTYNAISKALSHGY